MAERKMTAARWRCLLVVSVVLVSGCTGGGSDDASGERCDPTVLEHEPMLGPMEAKTESSSSDVEAWMLFFPSWEVEPGDPVTLPADQEIKIVWKITGDEDLSFKAINPADEDVPPLWVPTAQGSNWERPGDERGTGWLLPTGGCWTFEARRGDDIHRLVALVE